MKKSNATNMQVETVVPAVALGANTSGCGYGADVGCIRTQSRWWSPGRREAPQSWDEVASRTTSRRRTQCAPAAQRLCAAPRPSLAGEHEPLDPDPLQLAGVTVFCPGLAAGQGALSQGRVGPVWRTLVRATAALIHGYRQ